MIAIFPMIQASSFSALRARRSKNIRSSCPRDPGRRSARPGLAFVSLCVYPAAPPKNRPIEQGVPASTSVYIVEAREIDPPVGVQPARWRLLTSHRVETFEQARWITQLYRRRWVIEQVFRTIKTKGFDIENVSMEPAPFKTLCAMTLIAGISCMQLVAGPGWRRQTPAGGCIRGAGSTGP